MKHLPNLLAALALTLSVTDAGAITFTANTTINAGVTTYDGEEITVNGCTLTVNGSHTFAKLLVTGNGVVKHSPAPGGDSTNSLNLTITGDATVEEGSRIDVTALGYGAQAGPGKGTGAFYGGAGGGHGGEGGGSIGGAGYGSVVEPVDFGSGGGNGGYGPGGAGGGVVRISVGGTLSIAGQILANGQDIGGGYGAGGAGGSLNLRAETLAGGGEIRADGGSGANGGGGGRIALHYTTNSFTGTIRAIGGAGGTRGGAGTVYHRPSTSGTGRVLVDNGGFSGAQTPLLSPAAFELTVANAGIVLPAEALNLASLRVASMGVVVYPSAQPGFAATITGDATVEAGGSINASCHLTVQGDLLVAAGGVISANGKGWGSDSGPGLGIVSYYNPSGAGYGGPGGNADGVGGKVYGSVLEPLDLGSGGGRANVCGGGCPGGAGGGAIRLEVGGTLTVEGELTANGAGGAGGGSGGSLFVTAGTLAGGGVVAANGGTGGDGDGGGGGGRIALYYSSNTFTGSISALGGPGGSGSGGGHGTIYTKPADQTVGTVLVDGTGRSNAVETPITSPEPFALTLVNATVYPESPLLLGSLLIKANGTLTHPARGSRMQVTVLGGAMVESGGAISVDGRGYGSDAGPGAGRLSYYYASGAGYGGQGAQVSIPAEPTMPGGVTYGSAMLPIDLGSGGGRINISGALGGSGGGAIQLTVRGTLTVDGRISANGGSGVSGGSGGSVLLMVGELAGNGAIRADGGAAGGSYCGGGGGGRIAIYANSRGFIGTTTANGGASGANGNRSGEGTIHEGPHQAPMVILQSPTGNLPRFVSYVDVTFNQPIDPAFFGPDDLVLNTPNGPLSVDQFTITGGGGVTWRIGFPPQFTNGAYSLSVGPFIYNLFGQQMAQAHQSGYSVNYTTPVMTIHRSGTTMHLGWSSVMGLSYQLQSTVSLSPANWINEGAPVAGTGGLMSTTVAMGAAPQKFFRLLLLEN